MTCYHPLKAFELGEKPNGKKDLKICSYHVHHLERRVDGTLVKCGSDVVSPYSKSVISDFITIPCGQCIGCRIDKSREWANRMLMEAKYHEHNVFLTLTYDDFNVPKSEFIDCLTGEIATSYTLRKKDFQNFMKRLRKEFTVYDPYSGKALDYSKIRFYAAGEYGSKGLRPHYHAIIFNLNLKDLVFHHRDSRGFIFYTSPTIERLWPFGFHLISKVTWETCAYTARYITKKLNGSCATIYDAFNIEPEFSLMSRKPGIGFDYYNEYKDELYERYIIRVSTPTGPLSFKPPRYFDNLFDIECPEVLAEIKENQRIMAQNILELKLSKTDLSYLELLEVEERNFREKTNVLKRNGV